MQDEHKLCYHLTIIIATCTSQQHSRGKELKQQKAKLYYDKEQTLPHLQIHLSVKLQPVDRGTW